MFLSNGILVFGIIAGIVAGAAVIGLILSLCIKKYLKDLYYFRMCFVLKHSKKIEQIKQLNSEYPQILGENFSNVSKDIILRSKAEYMRFNTDKALQEYVNTNYKKLGIIIKNLKAEAQQYPEYEKKVYEILKAPMSEHPNEKRINNVLFATLENDRVRKEMKKRSIPPSLRVRYHYTSPQGRNHYENYYSYNYYEIQEAYRKHHSKSFGENTENNNEKNLDNKKTLKTIKNNSDGARKTQSLLNGGLEKLRKTLIDEPLHKLQSSENKAETKIQTPQHEPVVKIEEVQNPKIQILRSIRSSLTKPYYHIDDIVKLFENNNMEMTKNEVISQLIKFNFSRKNSTEYFVKDDIKNYRDLIRQTAEKNGIVYYENVFKDEDYDKAFAALEKESELIPIDTYTYLLISGTYDYKDVNRRNINIYRKNIERDFKGKKYFSLTQILEQVDCPFDKNDFNINFFRKLILSFETIKKVNHLEDLFTTNYTQSRFAFLQHLVVFEKPMSIYDLSCEIKATYNVEYKVQQMLHDLSKNKSSLYYSDETEKIYESKKKFLEEIGD